MAYGAVNGSPTAVVAVSTARRRDLHKPKGRKKTKKVGKHGSERSPTTGKFLPGNKLAVGRATNRAYRPKSLLKLERQAPDAWREARDNGRRAARARIAEYGDLHGGDQSTGICALLCDAADVRADGLYLRSTAAAKNSPEMLKLAAGLLNQARQLELTAWELAAREAECRRREEEDRRSPGDLAARLTEGCVLPAGSATPGPPKGGGGGLSSGGPLSPLFPSKSSPPPESELPGNHSDGGGSSS